MELHESRIKSVMDATVISITNDNMPIRTEVTEAITSTAKVTLYYVLFDHCTESSTTKTAEYDRVSATYLRNGVYVMAPQEIESRLQRSML